MNDMITTKSVTCLKIVDWSGPRPKQLGWVIQDGDGGWYGLALDSGAGGSVAIEYNEPLYAALQFVEGSKSEGEDE